MATKKPEIPSLATFVEKIKSGELFKEIQSQVLSSQIWTSSFRHGYADTPRNRVLQIASNVWLHLHPVKIHRHALRIKFTWCMGGITFLLFLSTVVTGVILMFYYRPVGEYAYFDMKYLQYDVPFGMLMRKYAPMGGPCHGYYGVASHVQSLFDWILQAPTRIQLGNWCIFSYFYLITQFYWISFALGSVGHVGGNRGDEHGSRDAFSWS